MMLELFKHHVAICWHGNDVFSPWSAEGDKWDDFLSNGSSVIRSSPCEETLGATQLASAILYSVNNAVFIGPGSQRNWKIPGYTQFMETVMLHMYTHTAQEHLQHSRFEGWRT